VIAIPPGVRVLVAMRPVDFRNYAERKIMRSAGQPVRASNAIPVKD
jgi:hypothetical protein